MKKLLVILGGLLVALVAVLVLRAGMLESRQVTTQPVRDLPVDIDRAAQHLAGAVRFPTVARVDGWPEDPAALRGLQDYLVASYPRVQATLEREVIADSSLLYTWAGSDSSLPPLLLLSHMDVVPVEAATAARWSVPPFSGRIAGGWIWGRGTLDDKLGVVGILEGVELLLSRGYTPRRTILLAFGHDEEVGGHRGAEAISALLLSRHVAPALVLDEGGLVSEGLLAGLGTVALVGTAEKGYLSLDLRAEAAGGHSSMPPQHTAIGRLAMALARLESHPMPAHIRGATADCFAFLAPELPFARRLVLSNLWLFEPLAVHLFSASPESNATIRTTTAETIVAGGVKDNVLPQEARATVNFRILPGDSIAAVEAHVRDTIDDPGIAITRTGGMASEPMSESSASSPEFELLARTARPVFPGVIVAPNLLSGATDSRHYANLCKARYRFAPMRLGPRDLGRIHGTDERIGVQNFGEVVRFYAQLIRNAAS